MARVSLDSIAIASPCHEAWAAMTGDDQVRFCASCRKKVFNLSAMGSADAAALVAANAGGMCVRLYRRADGTVLTEDCPVGLRAVRRRLALLLGALAAGVLLVFGWGAGLLGNSSRRVRDVEPFRTLINLIDPGFEVQTGMIINFVPPDPDPSCPAPATGEIETDHRK